MQWLRFIGVLKYLYLWLGPGRGGPGPGILGTPIFFSSKFTLDWIAIRAEPKKAPKTNVVPGPVLSLPGPAFDRNFLLIVWFYGLQNKKFEPPTSHLPPSPPLKNFCPWLKPDKKLYRTQNHFHAHLRGVLHLLFYEMSQSVRLLVYFCLYL